MKTNSTMSPTFAVIASGENPSTGAMPVETAFNPPTVTFGLLAIDEESCKETTDGVHERTACG